MPEQFGEKSHEPTPQRRQQAREQGQVAKSQDLTSAVVLIGSLLILMYSGGAIATFLSEFARRQLGGQVWLRADSTIAIDQGRLLLAGLGRALLPVFGWLLLLAVAINVSQVGFLFLPQKLAFDVSRIDPLKGLKRLFSMSNAVRLTFGIFKILVIAIVAVWSLWGQRDTIMDMGTLDVQQIALFVTQIIIWTGLKIGAALLVLAIFDFGFQRWKHDQDLRMTSQEVREEIKTLQGDPQLIARRRAVQRQLAMNRLGSEVPKADVVITNPTELAVAVRYDLQEMVAPLVVAKGAGVVAQRIRRLALENDIPVVERKELAQILYKDVDISQPIPVEQYAAIAEVLRYVYQLKGKSLPTMPKAA